MDPRHRPPGADPALAPLLGAVADGVRAALGDGLLGLHLVGSHALHADDDLSGVDLLAITAERVSPGQQAALEGLHARLPDLPGPLAARVGLSYAPSSDLRSPMSVGRAWPHVDNGSRALLPSAHDNTLHTRWIARERGIAVAGPPASTYVAPVDGGALRAEMIGVARSRAEGLEENPEQLRDGWYQPHLVITLCRALHTTHTGEVTGRTAAARWALDIVGEEHRDVVRRALADRPDRRSRGRHPADPDLAAPTRALAWEVHRMIGAEALRLRVE